MESLIFIDTNILLDFYRAPAGSVALSLLSHIDSNRDKIITTDQVQMEYKKNRQTVILNSLKQLKKPSLEATKPPAFLSEAKVSRKINRASDQIENGVSALKARMDRVLQSPSVHDPVYKVFQRLFNHAGPYCLSRKDETRFKIRRLARKRFVLGYPPRKNNDISIGDAINWEWIIQCAESSRKNIVIVSRDSDYGIVHDGKSFLNDWLLLEFRERVSKKRKIVLTGKLSEAFKLAAISVSRQEEVDEDKLLEQISFLGLPQIEKKYLSLDEAVKLFVSLESGQAAKDK